MKEKIEKVLGFIWKKILFPIFVGLLVTVCMVLMLVGIKDLNYKEQPKPNPFTQIHTPQEISIALDESNNLLIFTRKTGDYIIYDDSVGQIIFKMYCNKIYKEVNQNGTK